MKRFLILILFLFSTRLFAQTPGYMGKRFTVMYANSISPGFLTYLYGDKLHPVLSHTLKMNVIVSKQREICLAAQFSNRKIGIEENHLLPNEIIYEKFGSVEYSLGFKRFNRSKFAPLGAYAKWDISYILGWVKYDGYTTYSTNQTTNVEEIVNHGGGLVKFKGLGGSYSRGRQRVFKDKFVVDFGLRGTLLFFTEAERSRNNYEDQIGSHVTGSLNLNPIVNAYIGIGFLAF